MSFLPPGGAIQKAKSGSYVDNTRGSPVIALSLSLSLSLRTVALRGKYQWQLKVHLIKPTEAAKTCSGNFRGKDTTIIFTMQVF